ncbi:MAG TPA: hypothetical protein PKC59_08745 [Burkholderiaceae bacterium]|nr:hypothetical protein [Burkholderiaceae bacterium]HMX10046.1 hypothetical protein [Burkholderiaceae bacterium]HMY98938.1 hypothetical protein [Burkholderiaceae bacterium]HNG79094.1 hypothetical protein [Burkholderiaceae bacterium]
MGKPNQGGLQPVMPARRLLTMALALGAATGPLSLWAADTGPTVEFEWSVPAARLERARGDLGFRDDQIRADASTVGSDRGLPLIYILIGAASLIELSRALYDIYRDLKAQDEGATIIDATGKKLVISHDLKGPPGKILVRQPGGKVEVLDGRKGYDSAKWLELLGAVVKGAGGAGK